MLGIVFIHGLNGNKGTWHSFKKILMSDYRYKSEVIVKLFSYPTSIFNFGIGKKIPLIEDVAESLKSFLELECGDCNSILIVSHSMGGLISRQYLINREKFNISKPHISGLMMYATPNNGADLASLGKYLSLGNRQISQLCKSSSFIETLNKEWGYLDVGSEYVISYAAALGDKVVDKDSAKHYWGNDRFHLLKDKNHKNIVQIKSRLFDVRCGFILKSYSKIRPFSGVEYHGRQPDFSIRSWA